MENEKRISASVSGSFNKFKKEIDQAIDQLEQLGVNVLGPDKGWLHIAPTRIYTPKDFTFRPLPSERGMTETEVEDRFLEGVRRSDFLYVVNPGGYIGEKVAFEIGQATGLQIPIFSTDKLSLTIVEDIEKINLVKQATIEEAIREVRGSILKT